MNVVKLLHVLFMIIWVGQLLSLSRLLGYNGKVSLNTLKEMIPLYMRMYFYVELPSMVLTIALGTILWVQKPFLITQPYFHMKLTFVGILVLLDLLLGRWLYALSKHVKEEWGVKYKILHGSIGLALIGVLVAIYILKVSSAS